LALGPRPLQSKPCRPGGRHSGRALALRQAAPLHSPGGACTLLPCPTVTDTSLFAGNVLGCVHAADGTSTVGCPHMALAAGPDTIGHGAATAASDTDASCQKCNLGVVAAGWHLVGVELPVLAVPQPDLPDGKIS